LILSADNVGRAVPGRAAYAFLTWPAAPEGEARFAYFDRAIDSKPIVLRAEYERWIKKLR